MASIFKRSRWVDSNGHQCRKDTPGARQVQSRFWTIEYRVNGCPQTRRGFTDKAATSQLAATLERENARGEAGLIDIYKPHRNTPIMDHVAYWIGELRQHGRSGVYVRQCETRLRRITAECGWKVLTSIGAETFIRWRASAKVVIGTTSKPGTNIKPMGARTQNHYLEALRTFCLWAVKRKRMQTNPTLDIEPVETVGRLRGERRALTEDEVNRLLGVVHSRHQLVYRLALGTGLRRNELKQLKWGDVKLNAPVPLIQLRAETTKAKRADSVPLRSDLAELLKQSRGDAADDCRVCRSVPTLDTHKRYIAAAKIAYVDDRNRRVDFHSLRHTYGTMLSKCGVSPRTAMALMRHTDIKLTMNTYTDPRIFDMTEAVERLPKLVGMSRGNDSAVGADASESVRTPLSQTDTSLTPTDSNTTNSTQGVTTDSSVNYPHISAPVDSSTEVEAEGIEPSSQDNVDVGLYMFIWSFDLDTGDEDHHPSPASRRQCLTS